MSVTETPSPLAARQPGVRTDLLAGHEAAWRRIADSGTWWSGPERVAIAAAVRAAWSCAACERLSRALSPNVDVGDHDRSDEALEPEVTRMVHRLVRDQQRLTGSAIEQFVEHSGRRIEHYVELLGVVTQVVSLDTLHLALGLDLEHLPEPLAGAPSRYEPPGVLPEEAWVPMILPENLGPDERDLFGHPTGNVVRALSSVPNEVRAMRSLSAAQYLAMEQMRDFVGGERVGRTLSRAQMELIAGRVSALHECFY